MQTGAITGYIDVAQLSLYAFWIFFAGLIFYLRREDKREGYPLDSDHKSVVVQGFPAFPGFKNYFLKDGSTATLPNYKNDRRNAAVVSAHGFPGSPMVPTGNPMIDGVGPASYADREDVPDRMFDGLPSIVPLRDVPTSFIEPNDPDPRGMQVLGADRRVAGSVSEVWVDRAEGLIRYLEVEVPTAAGPRNVLLPMTLSRVDGRRRQVKVKSILASQFADVPLIASPHQVTKLEEDKIVGYFGGGNLYATPARQEPLL
jgi:photosynthetic reaction center H subunit